MSGIALLLTLCIILVLPFLLLAYAIFMFSENREYKSPAAFKKAAIGGVAGLILAALLAYMPYAGYRINNDWNTVLFGSYTDSASGIAVEVNGDKPPNEFGIPTFNQGTIIFTNTKEPAKSFSAGYRLDPPKEWRDTKALMEMLGFYFSGKKIRFDNWKLDMRRPFTYPTEASTIVASGKNKKGAEKKQEQAEPEIPDHYSISLTEKEIILTPDKDSGPVLHLPRK